ncbi:hypothetical protein GUITHDRAFT_112687 [Guillardia theta CCMP2712]|uniref:Uncharacterized protein n=1 Tax=Guillardia theta (strain CCMP2712) TaxID=905079 RepID=L1IZF9_GUITC|nr:hypothetical protein GUITHDRAFT_112687 [Guillardia theta CCMP2712]EKX41215.1 hypothetical protein GUITHDRAFT_112687 [Guillardia theta CCMP2712]|eukprot:XP_005828195.1 hypothetical protein GUITHDRAFT_112687 [Guillardia theta CCMP2712]
MEEQKETLRVGFMSLDEKHRDLEVKYKNKEREVESLTLKLNLMESNQIMLKQKCEELEGQIRDMQTKHPPQDASEDGTATSEADADVVHEFNSERSKSSLDAIRQDNEKLKRELSQALEAQTVLNKQLESLRCGARTAPKPIPAISPAPAAASPPPALRDAEENSLMRHSAEVLSDSEDEKTDDVLSRGTNQAAAYAHVDGDEIDDFGSESR